LGEVSGWPSGSGAAAFANPKSQNLDHALGVILIIGRLQIPMNDVPVVGRLDAVDQLPDDGHRLVQLKRPLQRLALTDVVGLADVGMIQRSDGSGLAFKALAELFLA
jgi:hypothetical protein